MGTYLTPEFDRERKRLRITDDKICRAARETRQGLKADKLGAYTYKKRVGLPNTGARDGARSIVFFKSGDNVYFFYIYAKGEMSKKKGKEIEDDEITAFCAVGSQFVNFTQAQIDMLLMHKELIEVKCDD